ncbi:MAG: hypothetical protein RLY21_240 [Planctomycetota bacterium]|jgi:hypothetical protein
MTNSLTQLLVPGLVAAVLAIPTSTLHAQGVRETKDRKAVAVPAKLDANGHGLRGKAWEEQEALTTLSSEYGIDAIPAPLFAMPLQDNEFYLAEDELQAGGGPQPLRFAVPVEVSLTVDDGEWIPVDGGRIWRVAIGSANATTARLHLRGLNVPAGQHVRLSSPGWDGTVIGPIEGVGEFGNGEAWSMSLPTNEVLVEWFVPNGANADKLPFTGADYYHGYRQIWKLEDPGDGGVAVGTCHLDPICFPTWANESNGTVRLIFAGSLCSGQLTATTAADETPYVSTANHCISTQSVANSCQFNFFYRRNTCAASATAAAGTNVTGSDLVSTQFASDCTLLMIRPTLPAGIFWVGWTNASVTTSTASTGLHHPDGSYQRISFGTKNANAFNCGSPTTNWSSLSWNPATQYGVTSTGVTEGGSSGSAIYRNSDKKMYGVLTCGASSCTNTAADDGYGRWDVAVNTGGFATLLAAGSDDAQEQNDTCATAKPVVPGTAYNLLVVKRLDEDWYSLPVPVGSSMSMNMSFTHSNGDVDLELYSACDGTPVLSRTANTNNETFTFANNTTSSTLLMRVFLGADTRNDYSFSFTVATPPPDNDECISATPIVASGAYPFNTSGATNSTPTIAASCTDGAGSTLNKDVWFRFVADCTGTATISTCGAASFDTRIVVYNGNACPTAASTVIGCNDDASGCGTASSLTINVNQESLYYIRVGSKSNVGGAGTLTFTCAPDSPCIADVDGSGSVDGADLAAVLGAWGACAGCAADVNDSGAVDGADLAAVLGGWGPCP